MGFLYPFAAVKDGLVPTREGFILARDEIISAIESKSLDDDLVIAAGVYGSVIPDRLDHTRRSDVDVFLFYPDGMETEANQFLRNLRLIGHRHNVVVSARKQSAGRCRDGTGQYGPSFRTMWKRLASQGMMIGDPVKLGKLIVPPHRTVEKEMRKRIADHLDRARRQKGQFEDLLRQHPRNPDPACEYGVHNNVRPLHLLLSVARWMLWWKGETLDDDRKTKVFEAFEAENRFHALRAPYRELRRIDREYDQLLSRALKGEETEASYRKALRDIIERTFPQNLLLLQAALKTMDERHHDDRRRSRRSGAVA